MLWAPFIIAIILILLGLAGIFIPGLPDFIFIFLAVLIYGIWTGFEKITIVFILIVLGLVVLSYLFAPEAKITRAEMAKLAVKTIELNKELEEK